VHRQFRKLTKTKRCFSKWEFTTQIALYGHKRCWKKMDYACLELELDTFSTCNILWREA